MTKDLIVEGFGIVTFVEDGCADITLEVKNNKDVMESILLVVPLHKLFEQVDTIQTGDKLRFRFYSGEEGPRITKEPFDKNNKWYLRAQKLKLDFLDELDK